MERASCEQRKEIYTKGSLCMESNRDMELMQE